MIICLKSVRSLFEVLMLSHSRFTVISSEMYITVEPAYLERLGSLDGVSGDRRAKLI